MNISCMVLVTPRLLMRIWEFIHTQHRNAMCGRRLWVMLQCSLWINSCIHPYNQGVTNVFHGQTFQFIGSDKIADDQCDVRDDIIWSKKTKIIWYKTFHSCIVVLKCQAFCKQSNYSTYDLSLFFYQWNNRQSHRHQNQMIAYGLIGTSQQATCGSNRRFDGTSEVKHEIHHADDVKREIRVSLLGSLANQKREYPLDMKQRDMPSR